MRRAGAEPFPACLHARFSFLWCPSTVSLLYLVPIVNVFCIFYSMFFSPCGMRQPKRGAQRLHRNSVYFSYLCLTACLGNPMYTCSGSWGVRLRVLQQPKNHQRPTCSQSHATWVSVHRKLLKALLLHVVCENQKLATSTHVSNPQGTLCTVTSKPRVNPGADCRLRTALLGASGFIASSAFFSRVSRERSCATCMTHCWNFVIS